VETLLLESLALALLLDTAVALCLPDLYEAASAKTGGKDKAIAQTSRNNLRNILHSPLHSQWLIENPIKFILICHQDRGVSSCIV
jgi:hypothetical protein